MELGTLPMPFRSDQREEAIDAIFHRGAVPTRIAIPKSIEAEEWFQKSKLGKILDLYALILYTGEAPNGKAGPALALLLGAEESGLLQGGPIVVPSSGNTVFCCQHLHRIFKGAISKVIAVVEPTTPLGKIQHLIYTGVEVRFAKPGQNTVACAREIVHNEGGSLIDQYSDNASIRGHRDNMMRVFFWMQERKEWISVFVGAGGTTSYLCAGDQYLRSMVVELMDLQIVGVVSMSEEERVPGSRTQEGIIQGVRLPWREAITLPFVKNVTKKQAFTLSREFFLENWKGVGPTGGLQVAGAFNLLREHLEAGTIQKLMNKRGRIAMLFGFMDQYIPYLPNCIDVLGLPVPKPTV